LTVLDDWDCLGQRNTASGTVLAENLAVAPFHLFPTWKSYATPTLAGPFAQLTTAAIDAGIARAALNDTVTLFASSPDRGLMPASNGPATIRSPSTISDRLIADWPPPRRCWSRRARFSTA
jgi:alkylation response protein AidB-like acyl-CoA dehydrogenase